MKLKNHLIVTIPDFARHFSFNEFWAKRNQFVRDLSPDKVYYWDSKLIDAYNNIKTWVNTCNPSELMQAKGIEALEQLLGYTLDRSIINESNLEIDITQPIIKIETRPCIQLPELKIKDIADIDLSLHKIEFYGQYQSESKLYIGTRYCGTYHTGDFVYVTELNGGCVDILPTRVKSNNLELNLISKEGAYFSSLVVQNLLTNTQKVFEGVISFAILNDGYIFIDKSMKPIIMSPSTPQFMLKHIGDALYVVANNDLSAILYKDGTLKTTDDIQSKNNVYSMNINNNKLNYNQI